MVARCIRLEGKPFYTKTRGLQDHYLILNLLYFVVGLALGKNKYSWGLHNVWVYLHFDPLHM